jgi:hypothetical protein
MLESMVELLVGLLLIALTLLIGSCIAGSVVAALRAVNRGRSVLQRTPAANYYLVNCGS